MRPEKRLVVTVFSVLAMLLALHPRAAVAQKAALVNQADVMLHNGKIVTVDANFRIVQAVAIRDGKFIAAGANRDIRALAGLVVLSADILTVPDDAIKDIQAVRTVVGGRTVFQR